MRGRCRSLVAVGVFAVAASASAQERVPELEPRAFVRITAPSLHAGPKRLVGVLLTAGPDTIVVETEREREVVRVPVEAVRRVEVWDRTVRKSPRRAILISAGVGATVGLGALAIDRAGQSLPQAAEAPGTILLIAGLVAGPSAPSVYAGNTKLALVHLGVTAAMTTGFLASFCLESCTTGEERGMLLFMGGQAVNWLVGAIDGAMSAGRYRRWVEVPRHSVRAHVVPLPGGQLGVGVSVGF